MTHIDGQFAVNLDLAGQGRGALAVGHSLRIKTHDGLVGQVQAVDVGHELAGLRCSGVSDQHNLFGPAEVEIECAEHMAEAKRVLLHRIVKEAQNLLGFVQIVGSPGQPEDRGNG